MSLVDKKSVQNASNRLHDVLMYANMLLSFLSLRPQISSFWRIMGLKVQIELKLS